MKDENLKLVRKQYVFLLNYAVDILKKKIIESDDLVLFSNEVKRFNKWLDTIDVPEEIYQNLKKISFKYSPYRKDFADSSFLFFKKSILSWFQQKYRIILLNDFLKRYDKYLNLLKN